MADPFFSLETMAANVEAAASCGDIQPRDVQRWQKLFALLYDQVKYAVENWRTKIDRLHVLDDLWDMLEGPLGSVEEVQAVAQLVHPPPTTVGLGESDHAGFCTIDSQTRQKILNWIVLSHPTFRPTIVRLSKSSKDFGRHCMAPALGFDTTQPHHRPGNQNFIPQPEQDQYPVWYFFYGNLAKSDELQQRLGLPEAPSYTPARVRGGKIRSWRGKYRALVDADSSLRVDGSAYLVKSQEHEDTLRFYETEKYEVMRCDIEMKGRVQKGLVFRFAGEEDELG